MTEISRDDLATRFATRAVHAGKIPDPLAGAVMTPIYQTSTYVQDGLGRHKGYEYARTRNPTREALERSVAALEGGRHGFAFASGLAAVDGVLKLLAAGDHVVCGDNVYGGTHRQMTLIWARVGLAFSFIDASDTRNIASAVTPKTKMIYAETPTNPMMRLCDLAAAGEGGRPVRRGQHLRHALLPTAARAGRRHRAALDHQVPERPQRHGGWDARHQQRGAGRAPRVHPERFRRGPRPVRLLARLARHQDAGAAHAPARRQRPPHRRVAHQAAQGRARVLSGTALASAA